MKRITKIIKNKYYHYQAGEFLPIYTDGKLTNKREFHKYRIKWIIKNHQIFINQITHQAG